MIRSFLENLLIDPVTGESLTYDSATDELRNKTGNIYSVNNDVPVLLPLKNKTEYAIDALHEKFSSDFNYIDHYTTDAETFDYFKKHDSAVTRDEINRLEQTIASQVPANAKLILDVGCGNGWVASKFSNTRNVISMDISLKNAVSVHQQINLESHSGLVADVYHVPLKPNSIDCIIAAEIIEHVVDPKLFIDKIYQILKPGGTLIITTPFKEKIEYYLCVHCNRPTPKNAHLHSFNEVKMAQMMPIDSKKKIITFSNKWMLKLRTYLITRYLPLGAWKTLDMLSNKMMPAPVRMMVIISK
jgi:2-polyprenyl-3-methyl-5-hydroxy-6-metoxy-1,4-benzoquinol methylase